MVVDEKGGVELEWTVGGAFQVDATQVGRCIYNIFDGNAPCLCTVTVGLTMETRSFVEATVSFVVRRSAVACRAGLCSSLSRWVSVRCIAVLWTTGASHTPIVLCVNHDLRTEYTSPISKAWLQR